MAVASIIFDLLMRTASFETDTKRAEKRLRELKKEAEAFGKAFGVTVAAGAAAATYAILESVKAMDDLSKAAQGVGATTEALSALRYAADLSGVGAEQLDKALLKLGSDAPEVAEAFRAMGISQKDANGNLKDSAALLSEVAAKFATYEDGANKSQLAVSLFGEKLAAKMIPLLNSGADGLASMAEEAKALGIVVDTEAAKAAEAFNDNLTRLGYSLKGAAISAANELLPALVEFTDGAVKAAKESGVMATSAEAAGGALSILKTVFQTIVVLGSDVAFVFKGVGTEIGGMAAQLAALARGDFAGFSTIREEMVADAKASREALDAFQARIMALGTTAAASEQKAPATADKIVAPLVLANNKAKKEVDALFKEYERLQAEADRIAESVQSPLEKRNQSFARATELSDLGFLSEEQRAKAVADAQKIYEDYVQRQRELLTSGLLTEEQEVRASYERRRQMILALTEATEQEKADAVASLTEMRDKELAQAQYQRYADLLSEEERLTREYMERKRKIEDDDALVVEQRYQYLTTLGEQYHKRMQELDEADAKKREELAAQQRALVSEGFANMAEVAKTFEGEQGKTYQALFAASKAFTIADITLKQAQAIAKAWGENNYWVAIGLTAGLAAQFAGLLSSANSANFGGARADGGPVNMGRSYLVGERGPEYFTPNEGGRIIPNDALGGTKQAQPIRIVNAFDDGHIDDYMGSDSAEQKVLNIVRRNRGALGLN